MSQKNSMRRYLRQDTTRISEDTPEQVGGRDIVFDFDGDQSKAYIAYDNGCKKVWSNDDPIENPGDYRWDCPEGVDPPPDTDGGDRGLDDDFNGGDRGVDDDYNGGVDDDANGDDDDDGDTLIYECIQRQLCNQSSPSDPSAEGWEMKGVCYLQGGVCPIQKYDESKSYKRGDEVAVEVNKLLHECINSNKCNDNVPGGANLDDGWKLFGGCKAGENCNAKEFDTSKATNDEYNGGDEVFTKIGSNYGTIGSTGGSGGAGGFGGNNEGGTGGSGGGGGFGENNDSGTGGSGGGGGFGENNGGGTGGTSGGGFGGNSDGGTGGTSSGGFGGNSDGGIESASGGGNFGESQGGSGTGSGAGSEENGGSFKLVYQCSNKEKCNDTRPSGPSAKGWDLVGTCRADEVCAPQFADSDEYNLGDKAAVSVDKLLHECIDKNTCNDSVPGDEGWELIGGCKAGRICNAVEFDTSKAANSEYNNGDEVFVRIGHDYGAIGSTGESDATDGENLAAGENGDVVNSIYCPASPDEADKTLVTYAYEVETTQVTDANTFLPGLEGQILSHLASSMLSWCLADERLRRRLEEYGVSGIESFPMDVPVPGGLCSFESAAADGCFAIDGGLTLSLNPGVDSEAAADATRTLLQEAMASDALLNPNIPEVVKVKYLGNSYDDYVEVLPGGGASGAGSGTGATSLPDNDVAGIGTQGKNNGLSIALTGVALLAILLLALCCAKRRMNKESKGDLDTHGEDSDLEDDLDDVIDRIGGIGNQPQTSFANDPPGSFHMGAHHYTEDGVQYKSLSCAQCQASSSANASGILGRMITTQEDVNDLDLNDKNDLSFDLDLARNFLDFSRNDLGRTHSSINVRHCKSATCALCKKTGGVVFVKSHNENEVEL
eukprot:CAMPEP_0113393272 /NCGR_PEP_ID=MMETSP0013_2-20120614/11779_1 /TAXON_ID=2843 ORGANISM="Skeletonema costatum, Strain 1716" /NCGR_SAMPLE_ID=MMETSP0013_2 /ASSEMBLY_ACC=CAM_ASM_000158 /LENGTH=888 /DNA_ID=CAMNT_0000276819 /DNA_START=43 /DNA_END=2709 /DNA_ORIENTATION=- /assembly_acc=CAM_ASM_000158